jgi:hypothetical protein
VETDSRVVHARPSPTVATSLLLSQHGDVEFRILGPLEVVEDGRTLHLGTGSFWAHDEHRGAIVALEVHFRRRVSVGAD